MHQVGCHNTWSKTQCYFRSLLFVALTVLAFQCTLFAQGRPKFDINIGGMGPFIDEPGYHSSFLIGGGVNAPIGSHLQADIVDLDFGFGTTGDSRVIRVNDGTTRKTRNYQLMASTGVSLFLPLTHPSGVDGQRTAIGFGGGYAGVVQQEYAIGRTTVSGNTITTESITCYSCSSQTLTGPYVLARLMARDQKHRGAGLTVKYYMVQDKGPLARYQPTQKQGWLTVAFSVSF